MSEEMKTVKVAEVYLVEQDNQIVDLAMAFTDAVRNPNGAVHTLDLCRNALNSSGWVTKTVTSVPDRSDDAALSGNPETTDDDTAENNDTKDG